MNRVVPRLGWIIGIVLSVMPLVLWLPTQSLASYTQDASAILGTLAKICSLTGTAMFAYSLILSTRLKWLEWLFNGLDKLYKAHRLFGTYAFVLIMMHPVFLSLKALDGYRGGLSGLWLNGDWAVIWGMLALAGMAAALLTSLFLRIKHQTFIRIHSLLGGFFLLGAGHAFAVRAQLAVNAPLRLYMVVLLVLAAMAYVYHTVLGRWLVWKYKYIVQAVHQLKANIVEVEMSPKWRPISFTPGQFGFFSFDDSAVDDESHPYALCSSPLERNMKITVKKLGDHTAQLKNLKVGSEVAVEGPYGAFSYLNAQAKRQVWIAGGIGITPFLAMARSLSLHNARGRYKIDLYYCTKTKSEGVFLDELKRIARRQTGFKVTAICEAEQGFLTAETVAKLSQGLKRKEFFICGPPVMMKALDKQLKASGVDADKIHLEEFAFR